ncbi:MAG: efflux RND transporter periplasmic adaptor subunit [Luteitalea sp.]
MTVVTRHEAPLVAVAITALLTCTLGCTGAARTGEPPTTTVQRGTVSADIHTAGEFMATRTQMVTAPAVGGTLRLIQIIATGTRVAAGDVVMRFDPSEQQFTLEVSESEVEEADLELQKLDADRQVQAAQDEVNLLTARFDVRTAELDVTTNELLSQVLARKNELTLEEARRKLAQIEEDVRSRAATSQAALTVAAEKRQKAVFARDRSRQAIAQMEVRAPFAGIVAVRSNQDAGGGFFYPGMTLPDFREGDVVFPGRPVLTLLEPGAIQLRARVPEALSTSVTSGQQAHVQLDGSTRAPLPATVRSVSGMADRGGIFRPPTAQREFDVSFALPGTIDGVEPGRTARIRLEGTPLRNVLSLPRQAVFDRDGTPTVFTAQNGRFTPTAVKIVARTQARVVIDGVREGTQVALTDPTATQRPGTPGAAPPAGTRR